MIKMNYNTWKLCAKLLSKEKQWDEKKPFDWPLFEWPNKHLFCSETKREEILSN